MPDRNPIWADLTPDELEFQYNPQKAFPDFAASRVDREPANKAALESLVQHRDIAYGDHPLHKLDIYPANSDRIAPVHLFYHGGYWRSQDKENFAYIAGMLVEQGITTVIANYELCPASTLDGVANSALSALEWVHRNIADYGGNPNDVTISGHSAGAHLVAEALAADWQARGIDASFIKGAVAVSGIYDPAPAMLTSVNEQLRLTPGIIERHNVEKRPLHARCRVSLFAGGLEPWHWIDQTYRYAHHLHRSGITAEVHILPEYGHFDIITPFKDPHSILGRALLAGSSQS
ncbi:alpha/beta hydrolase [Nitratireductor indicus]|uniref:Putative esterase n=1 Tax=Nitratireductor indicus C115 TaxID=1231190 RepID=K2NWJ6_9HYPH|nr:alpha/beta hydrolase [Nitratireductor indicus]EKF42174.1 putative esterase [Nitratireductor indicus C115]MDS1136252.1 alpha/beta hydrolase [Nitratireductor indicus]SFQ61419.1 arylformamidase [Nitratireductor indicus]